MRSAEGSSSAGNCDGGNAEWLRRKGCLDSDTSGAHQLDKLAGGRLARGGFMKGEPIAPSVLAPPDALL